MRHEEFHRIIHELGISSELIAELLWNTCPDREALTEERIRAFVYNPAIARALVPMSKAALELEVELDQNLAAAVDRAAGETRH